MNSERAYSPEFKAKVVLEAIRERKTTDQIDTDYGIQDDLLNRWIQEFLKNAHRAFVSGNSEVQKSKRIEKLENLVGKLSRDLGTSSGALRFISRALLARKAVKSSDLPKRGIAKRRISKRQKRLRVDFYGASKESSAR